MNIPANLKYSNDHEWVRVEGNEAYVGITDFAQSQLGDIVFVDVPTVGENLSQNEVFGSIEAVKTVSDAFLPVGGEILEFNEALENDPALVNKDPYVEGWLIQMTIADAAALDTLLSAADYAKLHCYTTAAIRKASLFSVQVISGRISGRRTFRKKRTPRFKRLNIKQQVLCQK